MKTSHHSKIGRKGGKKVASMYGESFFQSRSSKGGVSCLSRYGRDFYREIRKMRKK